MDGIRRLIYRLRMQIRPLGLVGALFALMMTAFIIHICFPFSPRESTLQYLSNLVDLQRMEKSGKSNYTDMMQQSRIKFDPNFKNPCWFEGENLRCLPYLYIIGCKKSGTTDLFIKIAKHPDFVAPTFREAQWFAHKRFETDGTGDINNYVKLFDDVADMILKNSSTGLDGTLYNNRQITAEKSPSNLHINSHWMEAPGNEFLPEPRFLNIDYIQRFVPRAKLLIIFRNPVDRLFSDYYHEYRTLMPGHTTSVEEFHGVVERGIKLYEMCFKQRSVRSCVYEPKIYEATRIQIQLGIYYIYWQELLRLYPRDQILVLKTENLRTNFNNEIKSVFKFLDIKELTDKELINYKIAVKSERPASRRDPMLDKTAELLYKFYEPFNKLMAQLTGDKEFLYKRVH